MFFTFFDSWITSHTHSVLSVEIQSFVRQRVADWLQNNQKQADCFSENVKHLQVPVCKMSGFYNSLLFLLAVLWGKKPNRFAALITGVFTILHIFHRQAKKQWEGKLMVVY